MLRLSRSMPLPRWTIAVAILIWLAESSFCVWMAVLNHRVTRELVQHRWRDPTIILSSVEAQAPSPVQPADRRGRLSLHLYGVDWRTTPPVSIGTIPPYVGDAFIAAEDVRFRHHIGIDPIGLLRAAFVDLRAGGIAQGGSTIDQQILKSRFLSQERTWRRKIVEMLLAIPFDARMSKDEILEIYLNEVYLGHSGGKPVLGIDEASRLYFNKAPRDLRVDEAALLASIVRAPNRDTPDKRPDIVHARRDAILNVMHAHHWIDDGQFRDATARDVEFDRGAIPQAPFPFYLRALRGDLVEAIGIRPVIE
jgi:membrane peptidoglycan carboxypeptidase